MNNGSTYRPDPMDKAIKAGVAKALAEHKAAGRSIAISKDGKVVIVPPEEIGVRTGKKIKSLRKR